MKQRKRALFFYCLLFIFIEIVIVRSYIKSKHELNSFDYGSNKKGIPSAEVLKKSYSTISLKPEDSLYAC